MAESIDRNVGNKSKQCGVMSKVGSNQDTRHLGYPASSNWVPTRVTEVLTAVSEPGFSVVTLSSPVLTLPVLTTQRPNGRLGLPNVGGQFGKLGYSAQGARTEGDI